MAEDWADVKAREINAALPTCCDRSAREALIAQALREAQAAGIEAGAQWHDEQARLFNRAAAPKD